jgi:hypothetical protein
MRGDGGAQLTARAEPLHTPRPPPTLAARVGVPPSWCARVDETDFVTTKKTIIVSIVSLLVVNL